MGDGELVEVHYRMGSSDRCKEKDLGEEHLKIVRRAKGKDFRYLAVVAEQIAGIHEAMAAIFREAARSRRKRLPLAVVQERLLKMGFPELLVREIIRRRLHERVQDLMTV
jgi:hypothetical protein